MTFIHKDNPLPIKKIYVDSHNRINRDITTGSDFTIELPMSLTFPEYSTCGISELSIPYSWQTVDTNVNDKLYLRMCVTEPLTLTAAQSAFTLNGSTTAGVIRVVDTVISLTSTTYSGPTLTTEIANQINKVYTSIPDAEKAQAIKDLITTNYLKTTYDQTTNRITIGLDRTKVVSGAYVQLRFFTDAEMKKMTIDTNIFKNRLPINSQAFGNYSVFGAPFNAADLQSANSVIGNRIYPAICGVDLAQTLPVSKVIFYNDWTTGFLNLLRYTDIYLCSEDLTSFRTIGPNGESSIIKKIPVTVSFGSMITNETVLPYDCIELGSKTFRQIRFRLIGSDGKVINLHGGNISFSLVFNRTQ